MRIIKFLFKSFLLVGMLVVVSFLLTREVMLFMAKARISSSLSTLKRMDQQKSYLDDCSHVSGEGFDGSSTALLQLRFISSNEYVVEVVCSQFSLIPVEFERQQLPMWVKKTAGSSGVIWSDEKSGVGLEIWGRQSAIGVIGRSVVSLKPTENLGVSPISSCEGFGFSCCQFESQQGDGQQIEGVNDCPKTCYESCLDRPLVLLLKTSPAFDQKSRRVTIANGQSLGINYAVAVEEFELAQAVIDYGDGESIQVDSESGELEHTYSCLSNECRFELSLSVKNKDGIKNADLPISTVIVLVQGGKK
jgi:hypothetical protein